jgi:hypothetical protein
VLAATSAVLVVVSAVVVVGSPALASELADVDPHPASKAEQMIDVVHTRRLLMPGWCNTGPDSNLNTAAGRLGLASQNVRCQE